MPIGPYHSFASGFLSSMRSIADLQGAAQERKLRELRLQQAEQQQKALESAPTDLTTLSPYTQEKVEYFGPVTGQPIDPEQVKGWNIPIEEAEKRGIVRIQRTPGATSLPELWARVQNDPKALAAFNQQYRGNRGNLVLDLGMKPTLQARTDATRRQGKEQIADLLKNPPTTPDESRQLLGKIIQIGLRFDIPEFEDKTLDQILKSYGELGNDFPKVFASVNEAMNTARQAGITDWDQAFGAASTAVAKLYPNAKSLEGTLKSIKEILKPSPVTFQAPGTTPWRGGVQAGPPSPSAPHWIHDPKTGEITLAREGPPAPVPTPEPLTQAAPPPAREPLLIPRGFSFNIPPVTLRPATPPPALIRPAETRPQETLIRPVPAPGATLTVVRPGKTHEQLLKETQDLARVKEQGRQAALPPEQKEVELAWKRALTAVYDSRRKAAEGKRPRTLKEITADIKQFETISGKLDTAVGEQAGARKQQVGEMLEDLYEEMRQARAREGRPAPERSAAPGPITEEPPAEDRVAIQRAVETLYGSGVKWSSLDTAKKQEVLDYLLNKKRRAIKDFLGTK